MNDPFAKATAAISAARTKAFDESERILFPKPGTVISPREMLEHYVRLRYQAEVMVSHLKLGGMPESVAEEMDAKIKADIASCLSGFKRGQAERN